MVGIIIKKYDHVSKAFGNWDTPQGRVVKNKDHYDRLMKENNMITFEESQQREKNQKLKPYVVSKKALDIIHSAKNSKDSKGRVKLSDRTIDAMKEIGAIGKKIPSYMNVPKMKSDMGGFVDDSKEYAQGFSL